MDKQAPHEQRSTKEIRGKAIDINGPAVVRLGQTKLLCVPQKKPIPESGQGFLKKIGLREGPTEKNVVLVFQNSSLSRTIDQKTVVGRVRVEGNDRMVIADKAISSTHGYIEPIDGGTRIADTGADGNGSRNGTYYDIVEKLSEGVKILSGMKSNLFVLNDDPIILKIGVEEIKIEKSGDRVFIVSARNHERRQLADAYTDEATVYLGKENNPTGHSMLLTDDTVSKKHAIVRYMGGVLEIEDRGSTNSTKIGRESEWKKYVAPSDIKGNPNVDPRQRLRDISSS